MKCVDLVVMKPVTFEWKCVDLVVRKPVTFLLTNTGTVIVTEVCAVTTISYVTDHVSGQIKQISQTVFVKKKDRLFCTQIFYCTLKQSSNEIYI